MNSNNFNRRDDEGGILNHIGNQGFLPEGIEITDRYQALGIPYPDVETMCEGQCEGTGVVPVSAEDREEPWRSLWLAAEAKKPAGKNGTHYVMCPDCDGTGKKK